jgi:hypothetical protein
MTGNGSPLDGIGRFSIVSLSFRVCAKANVGLMRAAPTPAASRKKLVRDKSLVSKDFELRRIVKRFLCTWSCCWDPPAKRFYTTKTQSGQTHGPDLAVQYWIVCTLRIDMLIALGPTEVVANEAA